MPRVILSPTPRACGGRQFVLRNTEGYRESWTRGRPVRELLLDRVQALLAVSNALYRHDMVPVHCTQRRDACVHGAVHHLPLGLSTVWPCMARQGWCGRVARNKITSPAAAWPWQTGSLAPVVMRTSARQELVGRGGGEGGCTHYRSLTRKWCMHRNRPRRSRVWFPSGPWHVAS